MEHVNEITLEEKLWGSAQANKAGQGSGLLSYKERKLLQRGKLFLTLQYLAFSFDVWHPHFTGLFEL